MFVRYILAGASAGKMLVIAASVMMRLAQRVLMRRDQGLLHLARSDFLKRATWRRDAAECDVGDAAPSPPSQKRRPLKLEENAHSLRGRAPRRTACKPTNVNFSE